MLVARDNTPGCKRCGNTRRRLVTVDGRDFCATGPPPTCAEFERADLERVGWLEEHHII